MNKAFQIEDAVRRGVYPSHPIDAIIFDCDGTLTDSMPVHYVAWYRTMKRYGIDFPEDRFYALGGVPSDKIIMLLAGEQGVKVDARSAAIEKEYAFLELIDWLTPIDIILDIAKHFYGKMPLAVASGGIREVIHRQLDQIECKGLFQAVVTAEDTERHKPDPDVFLMAAELLQVDPAYCLVYEDSDLGIEAAKRAKMHCIDVRRFHHPKRIPVNET